MESKNIPGFRSVPRTGVIYVTHEASQQGFSYTNPQWANLGQGSPETGEIPGGPPRVAEVTLSEASRQYSPVAGNKLLCQAVADFYNATYRRGKNPNIPPIMSASPAGAVWHSRVSPAHLTTSIWAISFPTTPLTRNC